jgi:hypothetical protein
MLHISKAPTNVLSFHVLMDFDDEAPLLGSSAKFSVWNKSRLQVTFIRKISFVRAALSRVIPVVKKLRRKDMTMDRSIKKADKKILSFNRKTENCQRLHM